MSGVMVNCNCDTGPSKKWIQRFHIDKREELDTERRANKDEQNQLQQF